MAIDLQAIRQDILRVAAQHGARNVRLFGSAARGEDRPGSDLDLLVDMESGRSLLDLVALGQDLEELLHRKVDVITDSRNGRIRLAELHWYEAHGIGKKELKRKRYLDQAPQTRHGAQIRCVRPE